MSALSSMLNGRESTGLVDQAIARLNIYQQLDGERDNLIQVSISGILTIIIVVVIMFATTTTITLNTSINATINNQPPPPPMLVTVCK